MHLRAKVHSFTINCKQFIAKISLFCSQLKLSNMPTNMNNWICQVYEVDMIY